MFQHTAARRRLVLGRRITTGNFCFNTQPPEGGWALLQALFAANEGFNTQPPEGGWSIGRPAPVMVSLFQHTAARRRLGTGG